MRRTRWRLRQRIASLLALAFGSFALDVGLAFGVAAGSGDGDAVDGSVDLAVAAAVEAVALGLARAGWDRCDAAGAGELGVGCEAVGAGDLADQLGGRQRPEAGLVEQLRGGLGDELGDLGLEILGGACEVADLPQLLARDANARGLLNAGQAASQPVSP